MHVLVRKNLKALLARGANINTVDSDGQTALISATTNDHLEIVEVKPSLQVSLYLSPWFPVLCSNHIELISAVQLTELFMTRTFPGTIR